MTNIKWSYIECAAQIVRVLVDGPASTVGVILGTGLERESALNALERMVRDGEVVRTKQDGVRWQLAPKLDRTRELTPHERLRLW